MGSCIVLVCIVSVLIIMIIEDLKGGLRMVLFSDRVYRVLKWICILFLPALATLWFTLGKIWGFPYLAEVEGTIVAIDTFLGALIGISTLQYNKLGGK